MSQFLASLRAKKLCWKNHLRDTLRYGSLSRWVASRVFQFAERLRANPVTKLQQLNRALRLAPTVQHVESLRPRIEKILSSITRKDVPWSQLTGDGRKAIELPKGIIIKPPVSAQEKGIIYLTFGDHWLRLLRSGHSKAIAQEYDLVLGPSYSPPPDFALELMVRDWPGKLYTLLSNFDDAPLMKALSPRIQPIPLLASNWVDPDEARPFLTEKKRYDIVMLAHFAAIKRHWVLFDAVRKMSFRPKILLMGVALDGRDENDVRQEARCFGIEDCLNIVTRPSRDQLWQGLAQSKTSIICTQQEGSCIAVVESMFADTPVALMRTARIGSAAYVNEKTGTMLDSRSMPQQLEQFIRQAGSYRARQWAVRNVCCHQSLQTLNEFLREDAERNNLPWTQNLIPFKQAILPDYLSPESELALAPHYLGFFEKYNLRLGKQRLSTQPGTVLPVPLTAPEVGGAA